jgi:hypothetical protein
MDVCDVCGEAVSHRGLHAAEFHKGEVKCEHAGCGQAFNQRSSLALHVDKSHNWYACPEEGCVAGIHNDEESVARHVAYHEAKRASEARKMVGGGAASAPEEEATPAVPEGYEAKGDGGCGETHEDGRTCARPYECKHDATPRGYGGTRYDADMNLEVRSRYICAVEGCGAKATCKKAMRSHMALHAGEMLCKCEECGEAFRTCAARMTHMKLRKHFFLVDDMVGHLKDEVRIAAVLKGAKMPFNWHTEVGIEGGKWRTVDFTLTSKHHIVCVEVDDGGGHKSRRQKAELERMEAIANAMHDRPPAGRPVTFIRYNADAYTVDGVERTTPRAKREARLVKAIRDARKYHEERLTIVYMYYDVVTDGKGRATPVIHGRTEYIDAFKSSCGDVVY